MKTPFALFALSLLCINPPCYATSFSWQSGPAAPQTFRPRAVVAAPNPDEIYRQDETALMAIYAPKADKSLTKEDMRALLQEAQNKPTKPSVAPEESTPFGKVGGLGAVGGIAK